MRRSPRVIAALALGLVTASGVTLVRAGMHARARDERFAHGETPLAVIAPANVGLRLFRSGVALDDATPVGLEAPETWLAEDRYFVEASDGRSTLRYPVPVGAGGGPDGGRSFAVIVRPPGPGPAGPRPFAFVGAGHFLIGDRKNPQEPHFVWVPGFFLDPFEVTNAEFREFLADPRGHADGRHWSEEGRRWKDANGCAATALLRPGDPDYERFGRDDLPVVLVTWHEAYAFGRWKTARDGGGRWLYRMPTEAEWEKAARGPDSFDYGLGQRLSEPEQHLYNWKKNPGAPETLVDWDATRRRFRPNRYGVFHASGNAAEWTQSLFRPYGRKSPYADDGRDDGGGAGMRTTRGGSWYSANAVRLHLAYREEFQPELRSNDLGFRMAAFPLP